MKIAVIFLTLFIVANAKPFEFNLGGWNTVVSSFGKINGVESSNTDEFNNKAEKVLKNLIEKHLEGKFLASKINY